VVPAPPVALHRLIAPMAIWSDFVVTVPWDVWMSTGDPDLLRSQYHGAKDWIDNGIPRIDSGLWNRDVYQFGDWLDPAAPPDDPGAATTPPPYVADAYLVHVTRLVAQMAASQKLDDEAAHYSAWASNLTKAFQDAWIYSNGSVAYETQTGLVLPLQFSLFSDPQDAQAAAQRLKAKVAANEFKIGTGFAGTHLIGHALTKYGLSDTFYKLLLQTKDPSWLYQVAMGGTTTWERWDSMLPNGTVNPGAMTSFNHFSHGSVASWIHANVGGLEPLEPGWRRFKVHAIPGGGITWAKAKYESPYGVVSVHWRIDGDRYVLDLDVPPNTVAEVWMPSEHGSSQVVGSGRFTFHSHVV
jgi:alpha-L-rhamnosidase